MNSASASRRRRSCGGEWRRGEPRRTERRREETGRRHIRTLNGAFVALAEVACEHEAFGRLAAHCEQTHRTVQWRTECSRFESSPVDSTRLRICIQSESQSESASDSRGTHEQETARVFTSVQFSSRAAEQKTERWWRVFPFQRLE